MVTPVYEDLCQRDARGPDLQRVHWGESGMGLLAIDYFNPDDPYEQASLKHVKFSGVQVVMITPEEVINLGTLARADGGRSRAAILDLGRSIWLGSFADRHLARCRHFQLLFYDELFDVICEELECRHGGYLASTSSATGIQK